MYIARPSSFYRITFFITIIIPLAVHASFITYPWLCFIDITVGALLQARPHKILAWTAR